MTQEAVREEYPAYEEQRNVILGAVRELAVRLLEDHPEIVQMVTTGHITLGEIALAFELENREQVKVPLEVTGYHAGQAAHTVRQKRIHAKVAEMVADG